MLSDRERALIDVLADPTPLCAYALKGVVPLDGAYGPNTCSFGCYDEPVCHTGGPWPIEEFEDLRIAAAMVEAERQVNSGHLPDDHPLYAWWEEHCNDIP